MIMYRNLKTRLTKTPPIAVFTMGGVNCQKNISRMIYLRLVIKRLSTYQYCRVQLLYLNLYLKYILYKIVCQAFLAL
jgi:hypothetical protein